MREIFDLMLKPFIACLILTLIHSYLGMHVVKRGVIFVDLALAQVAAFGATVGILLGWGLHTTASYFCSLGCTLVGALIIAKTRLNKPVVPQEALIGIVYVIFAAASILVLSRAPEGGEELKNLMVGHILFIDWPEILKLLMIYSGVGVLHWFARDRFLEISEAEDGGGLSGRRIFLWDFLFYASFGIVVTSSTELAGVLLVFSFLIIPAVCGALFSTAIRTRLVIGWICGALASVIGICVSYLWDFPTGATIVCAFGVTLTVCGLLRAIRRT